MPPRVKFSLTEIINREYDIIGYTLGRGDWTWADVERSLQTVRGLCEPATREVIVMELSRCYAVTKARAEGSDDLSLNLSVMVDELGDFPPDVIRHVLRSWARRETFRPSLAEVLDRCQRESRRRFSLRAALQQAMEGLV